ncbi:MAG TPA: polysaccharide biosynthesis C-terminal domain-containing protein [Methylibium sp.]|uniref:lipid II flippase MurJ n=1 Tax=Methylibium sp. TaxID=2067992 RepID=UPI002DBCA5BE|nr:polysaccharide biosynthesis C-terminal domain-containing protein [Methylibium sp.]HEU4460721.1 polysaccharide biosynthesis C-terminal domain-containing protein [Methylibium sp.]
MRTGLSLGAIAAIQLAASLVGQLIVLRIVGVGLSSDAYIAAQSVPMVLGAVMTASFQNVWLPRFARVAHDTADLQSAQAIALGQTLQFLLALSVILWLASPWWSRILFPGLSPVQHDQISRMSGPLFLAGVFTAMSGLLTAAMRATGAFMRAEVATLGGAIAAIVLLLAAVPYYGVEGAAWITLARAVFVYVVHLRQSGSPGVNLRSTQTSREVWRELRVVMGGGLLIKTGPLVDRYWSSKADGGGMTLFNIAQMGINAMTVVLERAVLIPASPEFTRQIERGDFAALRRSYRRCLIRVVLGVAAAGLALLALRPIWRDLLLWLLRIDPIPADVIFTTCLLLLPSAFAAVSASCATAVLYAFRRTRVATGIGVTAFFASLALKGVLFSHYGIPGLAAATSIYVLGVWACYHFAVDRYIRQAGR